MPNNHESDNPIFTPFPETLDCPTMTADLYFLFVMVGKASINI